MLPDPTLSLALGTDADVATLFNIVTFVPQAEHADLRLDFLLFGASNRFDRFARYGDRRVLQTPLGRGVSNEADRPHVAALLELAEASCAWTGGEPRPLVFGETAVEAQLVLPPAPPKGKEGNRRAPSAAGSEPPSGMASSAAESPP